MLDVLCSNELKMEGEEGRDFFFYRSRSVRNASSLRNRSRLQRHNNFICCGSTKDRCVIVCFHAHKAIDSFAHVPQVIETYK